MERHNTLLLLYYYFTTVYNEKNKGQKIEITNLAFFQILQYHQEEYFYSFYYVICKILNLLA